ncbi:MAG: hypothetical protein F6K19_37420 [Cyanothece sp. SIO1E1]|nr:hypothetical protein [Cyanothece sp. SIO1E1]
MPPEPNPSIQIGAVNIDFCDANYINIALRTEYETALYDGMTGDATWFQRSDNVELGWSGMTPILNVFPRDSRCLLIT